VERSVSRALRALRPPSLPRLLGAAEKRLLEALLLVVVTTAPLGLSIYLHDPETPVLAGNFGFKYSDIVHGLFYPIFTRSERWFSAEAYREFTRGGYKCPAPYVDYKFEYPPLVGLLWYISTCTAFSYTSSFESALRVHYYIHSAVIALLHAALVYTLYVLLKTSEAGSRRLLRLLLLLSPSTVIYSVYNWDVVASSLLLLGVLYTTREKYFAAGLLQGLSVSTKLLTLGVPFYYATRLLLVEGRRESGLRFLAGFIVGGVLPFTLLYAFSPRGFVELVEHHAAWYCENCLYLAVIRDIWSEHHKNLFYLIVAVVTAVYLLYAYPWRGINARDEYKYIFLAATTLVLFNYVFSPQMLLLLTPHAILALDSTTLLLYTVADVSNALIITTFFTHYEPAPPWEFGSYSQSAAFVRNIVLLALYIYTGIRVVEKSKREHRRTQLCV
jgi:hypothetical protein